MPRCVFLSPHPDDAVWSCGGELLRLVRAGEHPLVITVFDGDATYPSSRSWRRVASPLLRRRENQRALAAIGAEGLSLGLIDAALRRSGSSYSYADVQALFGPLAPADEPLCSLLAAELTEVLAPNDLLYVPLSGPRAHVDHRIVRLAVERLCGRTARYYNEFPYALEASCARTDASGVADEGWLAAAGLYRSQVFALYGSWERFAASHRQWTMQAASTSDLSGTGELAGEGHTIAPKRAVDR